MNRPMLACRENVTKPNLKSLLRVHGTLCVTPKIDGIRCIISESSEGRKVGLSRAGLEIPNEIIQNWIDESKHLFPGMDGELVVPGGTFNETQKFVMKRIAFPRPWIYYVFDMHPGHMGKEWVSSYIRKGYLQRLQVLKSRYKFDGSTRLLVPEQCSTVESILSKEKHFVEEGYEGIILRKWVGGLYKEGRCTWNEGLMYKMKRLQDSEAIIIAINEKQHNDNEKKENAFGLTKRSKHKSNLLPSGTMGSMTVRDIHELFGNRTFEIGSGWDADFAQEVWNNQENYLGEIITYKFTPHGTKDLPRQPIWKGMRYD